VFSLQRVIDDIGRKRQERRFASQSKGKLIDAIQHVYSINIDKLTGIFSHVSLDTVPADLPAYIEVRSLRDSGLNAFLVTRAIEVAQLPRFIMAVRNGREEVAWQHYRQGDLHTLIKHDQELSGINVRLLTNDVALIQEMASASFNPPCPWVSFYELGPFVGSMQGNAEHWYHYIWDRYWEALTLAEQAQFLEEKRKETIAYMPESEWKDWVDGLRFRDPRTRDSR
jgi:hypothetical protein